MTNPKKIFVTGGAGFIGSAVVKKLCSLGFKVKVFDNLSKGKKEVVDQKADFVLGDTRDLNSVLRAIKGSDVVFHFAALIEAGESVKRPGEFFDNNLGGGVNVLEASRRAGVKKFIFSSTAAIYQPKITPLTEEDDKEPPNPYGSSKLALEAYLNAYFASYGFCSISLRYFNAYGPGELHDPETHVIPNLIKAALTGQSLPLYWKGEQVRDYIFIDDLVEAHLKAMTYPTFDYFNLGTGEGTKTIDLAKMILEILNKKLPLANLGEREGDPPILVASYQKAKKSLGWIPKTTLEEGLTKTIKFFQTVSGGP